MSFDVTTGPIRQLLQFGITTKIDAPRQNGRDGLSHTVATLSAHGSEARYSLVTQSRMTYSSIDHRRIHAAPYPTLLMGDRVSERSAASLRDADIQYIDSIGNAYIKFGGVLVDVRGRTSPSLVSEQASDSAVNLFSTRRSQVVMALLAWPHLVRETRREIAKVAGVSTGAAHETLSLLLEMGYLRGPPPTPDGFAQLLHAWAREYPHGLGRKLKLAAFHADTPDDFVNPLTQHIYLSGESAACVDISRPATLTLYVDEFDPMLAVANRWRAGSERNTNVEVRKKFWSNPLSIAPTLNSPAVTDAAWPIVYADLLSTGDARLKEAAQSLRNQVGQFENH